MAVGVQSECVSTKNALDAMIERASSGAEICIANGNYKDWAIILNKDNIILTGETDGRVIMTGSSTIKLMGKSITVKNFVFTAPLSGNSRSIPSPINIWYTASFCSVSDCMIHDHAANIWVKMRGNNNEVHHCTFKDKPAPQLSATGQEMGLSNIVSVSDGKMFKNRVHHNKFINYDPDAKIAEHKHGSAEAVYVKIAGNAGRDTRNLSCSVHNNYFYNIDSEEETIGIKSSGNEVYENAIEDCYGGISLRHGKNNVVRNNFIKGRMTESKGDYGINVHDENHIVKDNWVMDVGQHHGIKVVGGNGPEGCNICHVRAKNVKILHNTLINSALHLGKYFHTGQYSSPVDITIQDLTASCDKNYAMITGYGLQQPSAFKGTPFSFLGVNRFSGKKIAYGAVLPNLKHLIDNKIIIWKKSPEDFGDYGMKMIRKIECEAGPAWEVKKDGCGNHN